MQVEIRKDGADYTLYVNGVATVQRESFTVVDRIRDELLNPGSLWPSEATEVADSIRQWVAQ